MDYIGLFLMTISVYIMVKSDLEQGSDRDFFVILLAPPALFTFGYYLLGLT